MNSPENVRLNVAEAYTRAVQADAPESSCCANAPVQKGVAVKLAGYSSDELSALPPDAVVDSFGCGNPLAFSEVKEGDVVLDLGSGAGIDLLIAGKKVGPTGRAIGIDMTDEMIRRANENVAAAGLQNVEVRRGIIEDMPVDTASVDWVISNCVINLSPDKPAVFREIARVLKPGGRMIVSDIVMRDVPEWIRTSSALYCSCVAGAISEEDYVAGLEAAGLSEVEVRERIVYDRSQLGGFIESELPESKEVLVCCGGTGDSTDSINDKTVNDVVDALLEKVWSAKFAARKPVG
jgi:SAM-dependent methyltransferase